MERLTQWFGSSRLGREAGLDQKYDGVYTDDELINVLLSRLAAYEDTGLEPEEVEQLKLFLMGKAVAEVEEFDGIPIKRLQELAQAEKDGRLVVLPCKVGDKVFVRMDDGAPYIARVQGISVSSTGKDTILRFGGYPAISVWGSDMGKTWFRSQKEAEAALRKEAKSDA